MGTIFIAVVSFADSFEVNDISRKELRIVGDHQLLAEALCISRNLLAVKALRNGTTILTDGLLARQNLEQN